MKKKSNLCSQSIIYCVNIKGCITIEFFRNSWRI